ncbi:MAG: hypothetical protein V7634_1505 [Bradyrhizobium sp.]|jgi:hypothetical protein
MEFIIIPRASHFDPDERTDVTPFDKLDFFFTQHLA